MRLDGKTKTLTGGLCEHEEKKMRRGLDTFSVECVQSASTSEPRERRTSRSAPRSPFSFLHFVQKRKSLVSLVSVVSLSYIIFSQRKDNPYSSSYIQTKNMSLRKRERRKVLRELGAPSVPKEESNVTCSHMLSGQQVRLREYSSQAQCGYSTCTAGSGPLAHPCRYVFFLRHPH